MDLAAKLQIKPDLVVALVGVPAGLPADLGLGRTTSADTATADVVVAFATRESDLVDVAAPAVEAARHDRLAWIAYPKAGQLGTDLNRDRLAAIARARGVEPVRQVAIDDVWSALRFRPA